MYSSFSSIYLYSIEDSLQRLNSGGRSPATGPAGLTNSAVNAPTTTRGLRELLGTLAYKYYNWRTGTGSDIITFFILGMLVTAGLVSINYTLLHAAAGGDLRNLWVSFYEVVQLSFQDGFPELDDPDLRKGVALLVATTGLVLFTILLALVEQFFLEVLESNVERGSAVYEQGHMLVLAWMESALSLNAVWKILQQACEANRSKGGGVIVVLTDESKLKMEHLFSRYIPEEQRHGSKFVFRQGSPLIPEQLEYVSARTAGRIVIVSDSSRMSTEADAQALRTAVLLDEMYEPGEPRGPIIVELKTGVSAQLLRSVCADYVIPLSTYNMNSIRLARMVQRPVTAHVTNNMLDYSGRCQHTVAGFPELAGTPFRNLKYLFPDCTVMGVMNVAGGRCEWMPHNHTLKEDDELFLLRNSQIGGGADLKPTPMAQKPDLSSDWVAAIAKQSVDDELRVLESDLLDERREKVSATLQDAVAQVAQVLPNEISGSITELADEVLSALGSGEDLDKLEELEGEVLEEPFSLSSLDGAIESEEQEEGVSEKSSGMHDTQPDEFLNIGLDEEDNVPDIRRGQQLRVLVIGAAEDDFMAETINEFDRGLAALPVGSEVTLFNDHTATYDLSQPTADELDCSMRNVSRIKVSHIHGDPLNPQQLEQLPLEHFNSVIVLCDKRWIDPDVDAANGIDVRDTGDMLRMDSLVMMVQIHVRSILSNRSAKNVKIITEKIAFEGDTRYDDPLRLPLGFMFNRKDFAARLVAQIALQPKILPIMSSGAQGTHYEMRDPEMFVAPGEKMSYWALMERVEDLGEHLLGYVELPANSDYELEVVINPSAMFRDTKIAWGNRQLKLITNSRRDPEEGNRGPPPPQKRRQQSELQRAQAAAKKAGRRTVSKKVKAREIDIALRALQRQQQQQR